MNQIKTLEKKVADYRELVENMHQKNLQLKNDLTTAKVLLQTVLHHNEVTDGTIPISEVTIATIKNFLNE